jgi:hypothetical protein
MGYSYLTASLKYKTPEQPVLRRLYGHGIGIVAYQIRQAMAHVRTDPSPARQVSRLERKREADTP